MKTCSVFFAGAWKDPPEEVPPELGLKMRGSARQRGGRTFHARGTACAKAKQVKAFRSLCRVW